MGDICADYDFLGLETTEMNVFEHYMLYRFWY